MLYFENPSLPLQTSFLFSSSVCVVLGVLKIGTIAFTKQKRPTSNIHNVQYITHTHRKVEQGKFKDRHRHLLEEVVQQRPGVLVRIGS